MNEKLENMGYGKGLMSLWSFCTHTKKKSFQYKVDFMKNEQRLLICSSGSSKKVKANWS